MMQSFQTIHFEQQDTVATIWLNRPEKHNALNDVMIAELTSFFKEAARMEDVRVILLRGKGKSFCAGADLNYMKEIASYGYQENFEDGKKLARLFESVYACSKPTIAVVHGTAFGGANGLLAACDIVIAEENTTFAFSEVKLGISPATIGPYVLKRVGEFKGKELMMSGRRFTGAEAVKTGLANCIASGKELEEKVGEFTGHFMTAAPGAVKATKEMIYIAMNDKNADLSEYTADLIARLRASDEGQEGMTAFLEKREPFWRKDQ